jgi:hypothetical protein
MCMSGRQAIRQKRRKKKKLPASTLVLPDISQR